MQLGVEDVFEPAVFESDDVPLHLIAIEDVIGPPAAQPVGFHFSIGTIDALRLPGNVGMPSGHGPGVTSFQVGGVRGARRDQAHVFGQTGMEGKVHVGRGHGLVAGDRQTAVRQEREGLQSP